MLAQAMVRPGGRPAPMPGRSRQLVPHDSLVVDDLTGEEVELTA